MTITEEELGRRLSCLADLATTEPPPTLPALRRNPHRFPIALIAAVSLVAVATTWAALTGHRGATKVEVKPATSPGSAITTLLPPAPIPDVTLAASAWTRKQWLIWGGMEMNQHGATPNLGAAYDPATNTWQTILPAPIAPRSGAASVWTGSVWLITGGIDQSGHEVATGAGYNPSSRTWFPIAAAPIPPGSQGGAVWTGTEMIVISGEGGSTQSGNGAIEAYKPSTNTWTVLPTPPGTAIYAPPSLAWSGSTLYLLRSRAGRYLSQGGGSVSGPPPAGTIPTPIITAFTPSTATWSTIALPSPASELPTLEWWRGRLLVLQPHLGGLLEEVNADQQVIAVPLGLPESSSLSYDPATQEWTDLAAAPSQVSGLPGNSEGAVWTGRSALYWDGSEFGLQYDAASNRWTTFPGGNLSSRSNPVTAWTGTALLGWGGGNAPQFGSAGNGIIYRPPSPSL